MVIESPAGLLWPSEDLWVHSPSTSNFSVKRVENTGCRRKTCLSDHPHTPLSRNVPTATAHREWCTLQKECGWRKSSMGKHLWGHPSGYHRLRMSPSLLPLTNPRTESPICLSSPLQTFAGIFTKRFKTVFVSGLCLQILQLVSLQTFH